MITAVSCKQVRLGLMFEMETETLHTCKPQPELLLSLEFELLDKKMDTKHSIEHKSALDYILTVTCCYRMMKFDDFISY